MLGMQIILQQVSNAWLTVIPGWVEDQHELLPDFTQRSLDQFTA